MLTHKYSKNIGVRRFFKRAIATAVLFSLGLFPFPAHALDILLGTGKAGSFSNFTGRTICRTLNRKAEGISCKAIPGPGGVHNLTNLQGGSIDIALADTRLLDEAVTRSGLFKYLDITYDNLHTLTPVYHVPVTLVVRNDARIASLDDLKQKRVNAGAPRSIQHRAFDTIMAAKGWTKADFRLFEELPASHSQDTMAFCHGEIQAMVHVGVHPDSSLKQLFRLCQADLVNLDDRDIEKMIETRPALLKLTLPKETYATQAGVVMTFGTTMMLAASGGLDADIVRQIVAVLDRNREALAGAHPALSLFRVANPGKSRTGVPLHPGAAAYFNISP